MNRRFLLFQLYGPFAAWGSIAVGDKRPSFSRPSKSAIMGLLGAALGLKRPNTTKTVDEARRLEEQHRRLASSYYFACRLEAQGVHLDDYHTVQVPEGKSMPPWVATRTDELKLMKRQARKDPSKGTKQSSREHYAGMRATICLWPQDVEPAYSLDQLRRQLQEPEFTLYLGRKACPAGLPLAPYIEEKAANVREALECAAVRYSLRLDCVLGHPGHSRNQKAPLKDSSVRYFWESDQDEGFGQDYIEDQRWDEPASRTRWQFHTRREHTKSFDNAHEPQ